MKQKLKTLICKICESSFVPEHESQLEKSMCKDCLVNEIVFNETSKIFQMENII